MFHPKLDFFFNDNYLACVNWILGYASFSLTCVCVCACAKNKFNLPKLVLCTHTDTNKKSECIKVMLHLAYISIGVSQMQKFLSKQFFLFHFFIPFAKDNLNINMISGPGSCKSLLQCTETRQIALIKQASPNCWAPNVVPGLFCQGELWAPRSSQWGGFHFPFDIYFLAIVSVSAVVFFPFPAVGRRNIRAFKCILAFVSQHWHLCVVYEISASGSG